MRLLLLLILWRNLLIFQPPSIFHLNFISSAVKAPSSVCVYGNMLSHINHATGEKKLIKVSWERRRTPFNPLLFIPHRRDKLIQFRRKTFFDVRCAHKFFIHSSLVFSNYRATLPPWKKWLLACSWTTCNLNLHIHSSYVEKSSMKMLLYCKLANKYLNFSWSEEANWSKLFIQKTRPLSCWRWTRALEALSSMRKKKEGEVDRSNRATTFPRVTEKFVMKTLHVRFMLCTK